MFRKSVRRVVLRNKVSNCTKMLIRPLKWFFILSSITISIDLGLELYSVSFVCMCSNISEEHKEKSFKILEIESRISCEWFHDVQ